MHLSRPFPLSNCACIFFHFSCLPTLWMLHLSPCDSAGQCPACGLVLNSKLLSNGKQTKMLAFSFLALLWRSVGKYFTSQLQYKCGPVIRSLTQSLNKPPLPPMALCLSVNTAGYIPYRWVLWERDYSGNLAVASVRGSFWAKLVFFPTTFFC